jgi:hypothetical protein
MNLEPKGQVEISSFLETPLGALPLLFMLKKLTEEEIENPKAPYVK